MQGRIRRSVYWNRILAFKPLLILLPAFFLSWGNAVGILLGFGAGAAVLWFLLCQHVKRLHDLGRSGWFVLLPVFYLTMLFGEGEAGRNQYGTDPRIRDAAEYTPPLIPRGVMILMVGLLASGLIAGWVAGSDDVAAADQNRMETMVFAFAYSVIAVSWTWLGERSSSSPEEEEELEQSAG
ncbi:MAG: hypothetical protein RL173_89 [Fibrobacterota bacterium]|jgi:hypothetical protein